MIYTSGDIEYNFSDFMIAAIRRAWPDVDWNPGIPITLSLIENTRWGGAFAEKVIILKFVYPIAYDILRVGNEVEVEYYVSSKHGDATISRLLERTADRLRKECR